MSSCLVLKARVYFDGRWGDLIFFRWWAVPQPLRSSGHLYHSSCIRLCRALDLYSLGLSLNLLVHQALQCGIPATLLNYYKFTECISIWLDRSLSLPTVFFVFRVFLAICTCFIFQVNFRPLVNQLENWEWWWRNGFFGVVFFLCVFFCQFSKLWLKFCENSWAFRACCLCWEHRDKVPTFWRASLEPLEMVDTQPARLWFWGGPQLLSFASSRWLPWHLPYFQPRWLSSR